MDKNKIFRNQKIRIKRRGFTLVEMLIIAPIVILVIGVFISAIVSMTGNVLVVRKTNALAYNIQQALSQIDQDVSAGSGYLALNNVSLTSPQGYNNDTTNFKNADVTNGAMLILNSYATTSNPISSTRSYVYATGQPRACASTLVNQNAKITMNIIYFVKTVNGMSSLWRRVVAPSNYTTVGCSVPWQQPSCAAGYVVGFCKTQDTRLVDGVAAGGFTVNYFESGSTTANTVAGDSAQTDGARQSALYTTNTVSVKIDATSTTAGRNVTQSGTIRATSPNLAGPSSCLAILNAGLSTTDGIYTIYTSGGAKQVYCDMQNGGWTRLNNNIATSTTPFNNSGVLITNNVPGGCGTPGCAFTINNISLQHSNVKVLLTRTTSIVECASLVGVGTSTAYWNGSSWVGNIMCTWNDGIFANNSSTNMTGLKMLWDLEGPKAANGEIKFNSRCSDGTDSGQIQITAWVK